jgi:hypothetical protein
MISKDPRHYYEGMNQVAIPLWEKFLDLYADRFHSVGYNVRVGKGLDPGPTADAEMRRMWFMVTTKRIDVVAERDGETWVIEIEPRPGLRTLGQVVGYLSLLPRFYPVQARLIGAVVSERMGFDMADTFRQHDVYYFVFPPVGYPKLPPQFLPSVQTAAWFPGAP